MKTRMFYTTGNQDIVETTWDKPEPNDDQIEVKSVYTGVCRSDIDMYVGKSICRPFTCKVTKVLDKLPK